MTALTTAPVSIAPKRPLDEHLEHQNARDEPINKQVKMEQTADVQEWSCVFGRHLTGAETLKDVGALPEF